MRVTVESFKAALDAEKQLRQDFRAIATGLTVRKFDRPQAGRQALHGGGSDTFRARSGLNCH